MRKKLWAVLLSAFVAGSLAACGGGTTAATEPAKTEEKPAEAPSGDTKAETQAASSGEKVTLRIMSMQQPENPEGPIEREIADAFLKEHPEVEIEWIGVAANDMSKKVSAMAAGNDLPDIITTPGEMLSAAYDMGILQDLNQILPEDFLADFYPNALVQTTINGELLLLPYQGMNAALLYRSD